MFATRPKLVGTRGMVASTNWLASSAGMAVSESGANAFDAAVATGLTLQVVEPRLSGPGGKIPIIFHSAERAETLIIGLSTSPLSDSFSWVTAFAKPWIPGPTTRKEVGKE